MVSNNHLGVTESNFGNPIAPSIPPYLCGLTVFDFLPNAHTYSYMLTLMLKCSLISLHFSNTYKKKNITKEATVKAFQSLKRHLPPLQFSTILFQNASSS